MSSLEYRAISKRLRRAETRISRANTGGRPEAQPKAPDWALPDGQFRLKGVTLSGKNHRQTEN